VQGKPRKKTRRLEKKSVNVRSRKRKKDGLPRISKNGEGGRNTRGTLCYRKQGEKVTPATGQKKETPVLALALLRKGASGPLSFRAKKETGPNALGDLKTGRRKKNSLATRDTRESNASKGGSPPDGKKTRGRPENSEKKIHWGGGGKNGQENLSPGKRNTRALNSGWRGSPGRPQERLSWERGARRKGDRLWK